MDAIRRRARAVSEFLEDRLGFSGLAKPALKKVVPVHRHAVWYYLGGMTLFLFVIQIGTGMLLLFYYRPSASEAYASVQFLMAEVEFGWLIRSLHAWSANLMILTLFAHMLSVWFLRAYRSPRELTWVSGMVLLALTLGFGFTGYLLPWNELSYFATRVGTEIMGAVPIAGAFLRRILRGGEDVTGATLTRFYAIHVAVLPALTLLLLGLHLFLVQRHGMSVPEGVEREGGAPRTIRFFPNFLLRDIVGWLAALALLACLAAFFPAELGKEADPFTPAPIGIKPEWYFMFMFQTLKYLPAHVLGIEGEALGVLAFGVGGVFLLILPFLDQRWFHGKRAHWSTWLGVVLLAYAIVLTVLGYTTSPTQ